MIANFEIHQKRTEANEMTPGLYRRRQKVNGSGGGDRGKMSLLCLHMGASRLTLHQEVKTRVIFVRN